MSFSPNGLLIASGGNDLGVRGGATVVNIWSKETGLGDPNSTPRSKVR